MSKKKRERSSMVQRGKGIAKWHMVKRTRKYSKRGRERKGCQENIQNLKRSIVGYQDREGRYV